MTEVTELAAAEDGTLNNKDEAPAQLKEASLKGPAPSSAGNAQEEEEVTPEEKPTSAVVNNGDNSSNNTVEEATEVVEAEGDIAVEAEAEVEAQPHIGSKTIKACVSACERICEAVEAAVAFVVRMGQTAAALARGATQTIFFPFRLFGGRSDKGAETA